MQFCGCYSSYRWKADTSIWTLNICCALWCFENEAYFQYLNRQNEQRPISIYNTAATRKKKIAISLQWAIKKVRLRNEQKLDKKNNIWRQIRSEYTCIIGFNHMPLMSTHNNQMMPIFQILLLGHNRLCDFMRRMNHLTNVWILHVQFHIIFKSWLEAFVADQQ